jgi:hypothetical protein
VSFLGGGRPRREDPELAAAARRRREAFAADIGDEQGRAFAHESTPRRSRWTGIVGIGVLLLAGIGVLGLLRGGDGGLISPDCDQTALGVSAGVVEPGGKAAWQATGPGGVDYVVTLDAGAVRADGSGALTADTGRILDGPFRITGCRSLQTLFDAPQQEGLHDVRLFRRGPTGWTAVTAQELKIG